MAGTVSLRSGEWDWRIQEVRDGETQEVVDRLLYFRLKGAEGSCMQLRIPLDWCPSRNMVAGAVRGPMEG
jgi:hypothetical protein